MAHQLSDDGVGGFDQLPAWQQDREGDGISCQRGPVDARRIAEGEAPQRDADRRKQRERRRDLEEDGAARQRPGQRRVLFKSRQRIRFRVDLLGLDVGQNRERAGRFRFHEAFAGSQPGLNLVKP